jgi:hypothetical protein
MKQTTKFWIMITVAIGYIAWTWYVSEPRYVSNNRDNTIQTYDWVSVPEYGILTFDTIQNQDVETGLCLQTDGQTALIKLEPRYFGAGSKLIEVNIGNGKWRVIGKGTIYHKVNHYIGFNLFLLSQILTMALIGLFIYKLYDNSNGN